jgi:hypothetical protein
MRYFPRRVTPSRFTRSYCDGRVRRRTLGNENEPRAQSRLAMLLSHTDRFQDYVRWRSRGSHARLRYKRSLPPKARRKTSQEKPRRIKIQVTEQVFRLYQLAIQPGTRWFQPGTRWFGPAIPLSQRAIPLQPDWPSQSPPQAHWWGLELLPERRFRFFARTPRGARHLPGCRCISS